MCSNDCSPEDPSGNRMLPTCDPLTTVDNCDTVSPHASLKCSNTNLPSEETLNNCASPHPADVGGVRNGFQNFDPAEYETYMRVFTKLVPLTTNQMGLPYMNQFGTVWNRATELRLVFITFPISDSGVVVLEADGPSPSFFASVPGPQVRLRLLEYEQTSKNC